ncbi:hypothetical protein RND71_019023 [Anisodus tanguticus]|uniref:Uncharacterized protein n=1 Tax=Anisodus tanguticus TaxID=243964 RepID=A0AAE1S6L4_9SOLA|nr:hypothetical protein RND71_019023 [Anisodus tanguticus]
MEEFHPSHSEIAKFHVTKVSVHSACRPNLGGLRNPELLEKLRSISRIMQRRLRSPLFLFHSKIQNRELYCMMIGSTNLFCTTVN